MANIKSFNFVGKNKQKLQKEINPGIATKPAKYNIVIREILNKNAEVKVL